MELINEIAHILISKMSLKYYSEDGFLVKQILKFTDVESAKVLDVGCAIGHYSFLFEKYGTNVIAFDYNENLIKEANEKKKELNSNVEFLIADGRYPEKYFTGKFDIIFISGFSVFAINLDKELMEKYISMLDIRGKLIFAQSSNLTGINIKTHAKNHTINQLKSFFEDLNCSIEEIYFYDRHIIVKILHNFVFKNISTKMHILISKITRLPCILVLIVKRRDQITGSYPKLRIEDSEGGGRCGYFST